MQRLFLLIITVLGVACAARLFFTPLARASSHIFDEFGRTVANGWGTSTSGHVWTISSGSASSFAVNGEYGTVSLANMANRGLYIPAVQLTNTSVLSRVRINKTLNTSAIVTITFPARIQTPLNTEYRPSVTFRGNGLNSVVGLRKIVNGVQTTLTTDTTAPDTVFVQDRDYMVRTEVTGSNPTTVRIKVWRADVSEPAGWTLSATDNEPVLQTAGSAGIMTYPTGIDAGVFPVQAQFDSYTTEGSIILPSPTPSPTPFLHTHLSDTFSRSLYDTWGNAEVGGVYTIVHGINSTYSVEGGEGRVLLENNNRTKYIAASEFRSENPVMQAKFRYGSPITGAGAYSSVAFVARSHDYLRDEYSLQASFTEGTNIVLGLFKRVNGTNTRIGTDVSVPIASTVNTEYMLKAEVTGKNPTTLRIKVWQASNPEPSGWNHTATDSEPLLQNAGENALRFFSTNVSSSSYPLMWRVDNLLIRSLTPSQPYPTPTALPDYRVDYGVKLRAASPLIFGGTHAPEASHIDAWNKLRDVGVSMVRLDLSINNFFTGLPLFPGGVTLSDWQNNVNNIQDPSTWNNSHLANLRSRLQMARERGMKTMVIIDYSPVWLTYSGTIFGVPQNMAIYKEIVKKSFDLVDDLTDYAEIWNEPSLFTDSLVGYSSGKFFDLRGSPYDPGQAVQAYKELFKHSAAGVREVNPSIPIIAVAAHSPDQSHFLDALLADPATNPLVDWVSYHNYNTEEPSYRDKGITPTPGFQSVKTTRNRPNIRIGVTEWNASSAGDNASEKRHTEKEAISFTGRKLSQFLKSQIDFANYYALLPFTGQGSHSFYRWVNNEAILLPQARTWRLLSRQLGLGKEGLFVVESSPDTTMPISSPIKLTNHPELLGVTDDKATYGVALTNDSDEIISKPVALQGLPRYTSFQLFLYEASETNTAENPVRSLTVKPGDSFPEVSAGPIESGVVTINFTAPARSVVAAILNLSPPESLSGPVPTRAEVRAGERQRPRNCPENFRFCSDFGPNAMPDGTGFVSGRGETESVQVFIPSSATPHDLHVRFSKMHPSELSSGVANTIPFPWSQGLNTAGEIYNIEVLSAFNGYPIVEFSEPGIVIIPFERMVLADRRVSADRLRIARYVPARKKWQPLPGRPVIDWQNNTAAIVSREYGYFAVVYR